MKRLWRWLFNLAAGASLLLWIPIVALQLGGGWGAGVGQPLLGRWDYQYITMGFPWSIQVMILHESGTSIVGPVIPPGRSPELDAWTKQFPPYFRLVGLGFVFVYGPAVGTITDSDGTHRASASGTNMVVRVPYWSMEILFLLLPVAWLRRTLRLRRQRFRGLHGLCPTCGYDLRATPERCPECGAVPAKTSISEPK